MIIYRKYETDIASPTLGIRINSCGLLEFRDAAYRTVRPEGLGDFQLLYIAEGCGYFKLNGIDTPVRAGGAILYAPGEVQDYGYAKTEDTLVWFCHFEGDGVENLLTECPIPTSTALAIGGSREIPALFDRLIPARTDGCGMTEASVGLLALLSCVARRITPVEERKKDAIAPALQDICEKYMCNRSVEEYAALCHLSKYHFLRLFKKKTGMTPVEFRNEQRLSVAERLLADSDLTVDAAAFAVGISSAAYFCRLYKKSRGKTCREK
jgi:AraC family transcriptional regulator of arabinose operon